MSRRITLKDGPLDGKTYDVPEDLEHIDATGGRYRLTKTTAKWEPTKAASTTVAKPDEAKAD